MPAYERAVFEVRINAVNLGDAVVLLQGDDILIPREVLERGGVVRLRSPPSVVEGTSYHSLLRTTPKLHFKVDERDLTLTIVAPPSALAEATADMTARPPAETRYAADPSAYLTYAPTLSDLREVGAFAELGWVNDGVRATSNGSYTSSRSSVRLLSQLVLSDRERARELTVGDAYASTGSLGASLLLGGLTFARNFELDPYLVRIPRLGYSGSAVAPSTLDVYVNDVLVRRVPVAPGEFHLTGLTPETGAGSVRYVLRDPLGHEQRAEQSYYASSVALARGVSEYVCALGFTRENYGIESFDYRAPVLLGRYRLGLRDSLAVGSRLELQSTRASGGTELTLVGDLGELEFSFGASVDGAADVARGTAGLIAYGYRARSAAAHVFVKATSERYATASLAPAEDRALLEYAASGVYPLGGQTSLGMQLTLGLARDAGHTGRYSAFVSSQLGTGLSSQLTASANRDANAGHSYECFLSLNLALPENHAGSLSQRAVRSDARDAEPRLVTETTASLAKSTDGPLGVGYQASTTVGSFVRQTAQASVQTRYFRTDATLFRDRQGTHSVFNAAGSLVWMPSAGLFFTRPINQAFAVVEVPQTQGLPVLVNNHEIGRTDAAGQVFVPDVLANYPNAVRVDDAALAADVEVSDQEQRVAPPLRGGAHVVFAVRYLRIVRGQLAPRGLALEAVRYGELKVVDAGRTWTSPIGAAGEFELEGLPPGRWSAHVTGSRGDCDATLIVGNDGAAFKDLGAVPCVSMGQVQ